MARSHRKKMLKLRKTHRVLSGLFVCFLILIMIFLSMSSAFVFITYVFETKCRAEEEKITYLVKDYNVVRDDSDAASILEDYENDYMILDRNGNIISLSGSDTCLRDGKEHIAFTSTFFSYAISSNHYTMYPDTENLLIDTSEEECPVLVDFNYINDGKKVDIQSGEDIRIPYWLEIPVREGEQTLLIRCELTVKFMELMFFIVFMGVISLILIIIIAAFVINYIRESIDKTRLKKLVFMDPISNDHNWMYFLIEGEARLKKARPSVKYAVVSLVFVKYRNFVLCHSIEEGEEKLSDVFRLLDGETDDQEIASHTGSSNFALLLKYEDKDSLEKRLWDIIEKLGKTDDHHHFNFHAGVVLLEDAASGKKFKLSNVDLDREYNNACNARIAGEDNDDSSVYFFDEKLVEDQKWIDSVHESQEKAVENEEFKVYYQPKYDPRTDELRGAEALIRWISPEFGFVPPGKFIPIFEQNGFITEIDHYMLRHVAKDQKKWLDEGYECVPVSVNISRAHFIENDLADQIRKIVEDEGCPTSLIEIELTESAFFDDKKAMLNTISKLQSFGFAVSMDDFGSGYSSLNSLKDLPLDVLKLDSGFFRDISTDGRGEIVVSEAIRLAKNLNMKIVAEGVEVKEQVDFLASEGCDMIQGYYYAKPMPGEEYLDKMVRNGIPEREEPTPEEKGADENEQNSPEAE